MFPLVLAETARFEAVRELLRNAGYTSEATLARLGFEFLDDYARRDRPHEPPKPVASPLDLLLALFFEGGLVTRARMDLYFGPTGYDDLKALGLVALFDENTCFGTVLLYPVDNLFICSDRWTNPDGSEIAQFEDIVYAARSTSTQRFMRLLPELQSESMLDLCSGTAVFALMAAASARRAYAFDIAARSTHFAEFNRRLNGIENVTCATGDLYEPAGDLTFDLIVAHPPYVPVLKNQLIFHDGGDDGESVLRRIVEDLPKYLRPGGRLFCACLGSDRVGAPFEQRIREWLGDAEMEFDVAVVVRFLRDPQDYAVRNLIRGTGDLAELKEWEALFRSKRIERLVYGTVYLQRRAEERRTFTVRRQLGPDSGREEVQWMLRWETAATHAKIFRAILSSPLRATAHTELSTKHRIEDGDWKPAAHALETSYPFEVKAEVESWAGFLVGRAHGQTGFELLEEMKREEILHPETPPDEFADALTVLISGGFLESEAFRLPKTASSGDPR